MNLTPDYDPDARAKRELEKHGVEGVLERCFGNGYKDVSAFLYTCNFLYIPHKKDKSRVCLADVLTSLQLDVIEAVAENDITYVLKSRKEGVSTFYAAWNFRHIWLIENFESLVMSLDSFSARYIKSIYQFFHDHLPLPLQGNLVTQSKDEMKYDTGGYLRSITASSEGPRGSSPRSIHASEFAQYTDIQKTLNAAMQAGTDDCEVILESTARGMNEAYKMWKNKDNGIKKIFISWRDSPNCRKTSCKGVIPPELYDAQEIYGFSDEHLYWATDRYHQRCGSSWDAFCQEYPMRWQDAFIVTGSRYFKGIHYPDADFDEATDQGYQEFRAPDKWAHYTIGVDVATGSPEGDFSAFTITECTDKTDPKIAATYYRKIRVPDFVEDLLRYMSRFFDPLAVIEINGPGLNVLERLIKARYVRFYRRKIEDRVGNKMVEKVGWLTTESSRNIIFSQLLTHLRGGIWAGTKLQKMEVPDERMQVEINGIIYNKKGKIEHSPGQHDDLTISGGLSLIGMEQCHEDAKIEALERPQNMREVLEFEARTGLTYTDLEPHVFSDYNPSRAMELENYPMSGGHVTGW